MQVAAHAEQLVPGAAKVLVAVAHLAHLRRLRARQRCERRKVGLVVGRRRRRRWRARDVLAADARLRLAVILALEARSDAAVALLVLHPSGDIDPVADAVEGILAVVGRNVAARDAHASVVELALAAREAVAPVVRGIRIGTLGHRAAEVDVGARLHLLRWESAVLGVIVAAGVVFVEAVARADAQAVVEDALIARARAALDGFPVRCDIDSRAVIVVAVAAAGAAHRARARAGARARGGRRRAGRSASSLGGGAGAWGLG